MNLQTGQKREGKNEIRKEKKKNFWASLVGTREREARFGGIMANEREGKEAQTVRKKKAANGPQAKYPGREHTGVKQ